ncbi:glycosyl transferase [Bacillus luti]|uniref:glycosyltransferase n=1 Tax=Bacillus luti TaxID=2026191 RepID=UPI0008FDA811|nr:glycosyltransferase [Bacillus luti]OJE50834.1 glycosyl transferase [Bacillus luti]
MLTSIIILTHNQLQYTKECIQSIRTYTEEKEYELIVVDNASTDGTVEWLQKQSDILLVENAENMGFPKGCNQGIKEAKGDNILLLNNDVVVTENWLSNLIRCLYESEDTGAVGPVTNNAAYYTAIPTFYKDMKEMQTFATLYNQSDKNKWEERMKLIGFCMLIKKSVLDEVGLLDERFTPGNYEDDDLSLRIFEKGYKLYVCRDTFIHHYGSVSWKEDSLKFSVILHANNIKLHEKWGFYGEGLYIHYDLLTILERFAPDKVNILHLGAGCGATLLEMKRCYPEASLFGAEVNEKAAALANRTAPTTSVAYDKLHEVFTDQKFQYILISHPIELAQFPQVLQSISQLLTPTGTFILSRFNLENYNALKK